MTEDGAVVELLQPSRALKAMRCWRRPPRCTARVGNKFYLHAMYPT